MNQCILTGYLGNDPEVFFSGNGDPMSSFSFAFKPKISSDKTNWIKVIVFKKLAEISEKYLHSGAKILITGTLTQNTWTTEDNQKRSTYEILASNIEFLKTDGRGFENNQNGTPF